MVVSSCIPSLPPYIFISMTHFLRFLFISIMVSDISSSHVHKFVFTSHRCLDFQLQTLFWSATLPYCVNSSPWSQNRYFSFLRKRNKNATILRRGCNRKRAVFSFNLSSHNTFTLLSIYSPLYMKTLKIWEALLSWDSKSSLLQLSSTSRKTSLAEASCKRFEATPTATATRTSYFNMNIRVIA